MMAVARATSPFMPQIGQASCQRKEIECFCQLKSEKAKHKCQQMILWKIQSMFLKEMNVSVRKNKKGSSWPCRLGALIGEHGSVTIK